MQVLTEMIGVTPLVMHNVRLSDPFDPMTLAIQEITAKKGKNRTDSENMEIHHLEFLGGLYYDADVGVYVPSANILKCWQEAAKVTKQGRQLVRAVALLSDKMRLQHSGPAKAEDLWGKPEFRHRAMVGVQRSKVPRMRPIFRAWKLSFELELAQDIMNPQDLKTIISLAGRIEGLGDGRTLGNGRFTAEVHYD